MGAAFLIAGKDLKLRLRDRSVVILGVITPLVISYILSLVFGPVVGGIGLDLRYGLVDEDQSGVSQAFTAVLTGAEAEDVIALEVLSDRVAAAASLEEGDIDAFFVVPSGLQQAVFDNQPETIEVVGDVDAPTSTRIAASFAERFSSGVAASQSAVATTAIITGTAPATPDWVETLTNDPAEAAMSFEMVDQSAVSKQLDTPTYLAAGMAVFFLFFTVQFGVSGLFDEQREGTLARLVVAPIGRMSVVLGKAILAFVLGVASLTVLVVATTLLMDADWGAPLGVGLLIVTGVLAAIGIMGLVYALARTPEGAGNLASIIAVILGMLGGSFFPIASSGGLLAALSYLTPHAWFLDGLAQLSSDAPWTAALPAAGAITLFALVTGLVAYLLIRRKLTR